MASPRFRDQEDIKAELRRRGHSCAALARANGVAPSVLRMAFLGRAERITAARARQLGIVSEVVDPPERLREAAQELAERIARQPADELAAVKRALWNELERTP